MPWQSFIVGNIDTDDGGADGVGGLIGEVAGTPVSPVAEMSGGSGLALFSGLGITTADVLAAQLPDMVDWDLTDDIDLEAYIFTGNITTGDTVAIALTYNPITLGLSGTNFASGGDAYVATGVTDFTSFVGAGLTAGDMRLHKMVGGKIDGASMSTPAQALALKLTFTLTQISANEAFFCGLNVWYTKNLRLGTKAATPIAAGQLA